MKRESISDMTGKTLTVNEIFYSIQGESLYTGLPCIFIRLTGCNLRCTYCDTSYAFDDGYEMTIQSITEKIAVWPCRIVEITGGEPLLQKNTPDLIRQLLENGLTVLVETNGTCSLDAVDSRCIKIVDIKCPGSGERIRNIEENISYLNSEDQLKFVITDQKDYIFAKEFIEKHSFPFDHGNILFSPVTELLDPALLAEWMLKDGLSARLQMQLHKTIWPGIERGV